MRKFLMLLVAFVAFGSFATAQNDLTPTEKPAEKAQEIAPAEINGPVMTFENTVMEYGEIEQNSDPLRVFNFTNSGSEPLVIKHAKGSCGCTVPSYPKEPILPGEAGVIEVRYDTKRVGPFTKTVTLTTNEEGPKKVLTIKGKVHKGDAKKEAVPKKKPSILTPNN